MSKYPIKLKINKDFVRGSYTIPKGTESIQVYTDRVLFNWYQVKGMNLGEMAMFDMDALEGYYDVTEWFTPTVPSVVKQYGYSLGYLLHLLLGN